MPSLGGGPPALSLLVGVARGVDAKQKEIADARRQAVLDAMRQQQLDISAGHLAVAKDQEQRLEEAAAASQAAADTRAADIEDAVTLRAGELMKMHGMTEGQARVRARAEINDQLTALPTPPTQEERAKDSAALTAQQQQNAERARQQEFDQQVQKIMRNRVLVAKLALARKAGDLNALNLPAQHPEFTFDQMLAAWKQLGGPARAVDEDVEAEKDAATVDANRRITQTGSVDAALADLAAMVEAGTAQGRLNGQALNRIEAERRVLEAMVSKQIQSEQ